jgi:hypothetical protein
MIGQLLDRRYEMTQVLASQAIAFPWEVIAPPFFSSTKALLLLIFRNLLSLI